MKLYIIGLSGFDKDIEIFLIEAENELSAMCDIVLKQFGWSIIEDGKIPFSTIDEGIDFILQGEINISKPVEIDKIERI